jgi:hypothetical protein
MLFARTQDEDGYQPVHAAAQFGRTHIMDYLSLHGVDLESVDAKVHFACSIFAESTNCNLPFHVRIFFLAPHSTALDCVQERCDVQSVPYPQQAGQCGREGF